MRIPYIIILLIIVALSLTQLNSKPQKPLDNFIYSNIDKSKQAIVTILNKNGYHKTEDSYFKIAFDRPAKDSFAAKVLLGTDFYHNANVRVTMAFSGNNPTKIYSRMTIVKNPASAYEQHLDVSNNHDGREKVYDYIQQARDLVENSN